MDERATAPTGGTVVVIGAAGNTGRPLVEALVRRGATVRAIVHRAGQEGRLPVEATVETAELADVGSLTTALRDAAVAYYIPPPFERREGRFGANVVAAALAAGLPRLVYHSVMHAATPSMPHHQRKAGVELRLRESPLAWTVLQPAMYSQTPFAGLNAKRTELRLAFDPDRPFTPVDGHDLAEAAATVLLEDGHEYATYELAGEERLSCAEMASAIGDALGHPVSVRPLPSLVVATAAATRFGPAAIPAVKAMFDHYDRFGFVGNPHVLRMLLGRRPTSYADVVSRDLLPHPATGQEA